MPYETQTSDELAALLTVFEEARGEIEYVLIGGISPDDFADPYAFHKAAAGFTIEVVTTRPRYLRSSEKGPKSRREPEKAEGRQITPAEFFQPGYIGLPFELTTTLTAEEIEPERLKLDQNIFSHGEVGQYRPCYHYAFNYPPYNHEGLYDSDRHPQEWLFPAINHELFGDDEEALTIYEWSTDWADYFIEGQEWWGSFLWTVYSTQTKLLVGIAASSS